MTNIYFGSGILMPSIAKTAAPPAIDIPTATIDFNINGERYISQYFDTGIVPTENTKIEVMLVKNTSPALDTGFQSGCRTGWIDGFFGLNYTPSTFRLWAFWNSNDSDYTPEIQPEFMLVREDAGGHLEIIDGNGTLMHSYDWNEPYSSYEENSYFIGDINENGEAKGQTDSQGSGRIGWVKFYENGVLTHNFRPAILDDEPCFYDEVTHEYLHSTGTADITSLSYTVLNA